MLESLKRFSAAFCAVLWAGMAWGGDVSISGTIVKIAPGDDAPYVVEFFDRSVNGPSDDGWYEVSIDGLVVPVHFTWQAGGDMISIAPPDGYYCEPSCEATAGEERTATIRLRRGAPGM